MLIVTCGNCGVEFGAKRKTAQYCSTKCRVAQVRQRQRQPAAPREPKPEKVIVPRRDGAQVYALPPMPVGDEGFERGTKRKLEEAGRLDSYQAMAALFSAKILDSGVQDTMSSMAAMLKVWQGAMAEALDGADRSASPLDEIREALKLA